ncbi:MAG TPA: hypothetical protein V6C78_35325 [Crinalium sp.]|jgi:hypothetical protein
MQIEHFSTEELSPEEIKQLEALKRIIEAAISDGRLSYSELEHIKSVAFAHKKMALDVETSTTYDSQTLRIYVAKLNNTTTILGMSTRLCQR